MSTSVSFAKIVGSATETMWSQIYHAGDLFAVVSLTTVEDHPELNSMGKELFNSLEADFFSLEEKKLTTIKEVIASSIKDLPPELTLSATITYSRDAILYLFLIGSGEILMRRGEKIGALLSQKEGERSHILSSSGYLQHGDILLLKTGAFSRLFSDEDTREALELHLPNAITEKLSSKLDAIPGDAAALALMYQGASAPDAPTMASAMRKQQREAEPSAKTASDEDEERESEDDKKSPEPEEEHTPAPVFHTEKPFHHTETSSDSDEDAATAPGKFAVLSSLPLPRLSRRLLFGIIAVLIIVILAGSIYFTKQNSDNVAAETAYEQTLREAQEKYDEAEGLKNLNAALAQDDYRKAQQIIKTGLPKVKKGSDEEKALLALLQKIEENLKNAEGATVEAKSVDLSESPLLSLAVDKSTAYVTEDENKRFALLSSGIVNDDDKEVIKNEDDWKKPAGIAGYNGNLYVLDRDGAVLKYTAGSGGFGKSSYFSGDAPSLTDATSIAIDGSVWILFSDGSIKKYTKAKDDGFKVSGLPSPLSSPKQLFTNGDTESLYVLDRGNSRVVIIGKDGVFKKAYKADVLRSADLIQADEAEDKIYILANKKLYTIPLE